MAGYLKSIWPETEIFFVGKKYTQPIIALSKYVDRFLDREELISNPTLLAGLNADAVVFVYPDKELARVARKSGIPLRIGTSHRSFHWLYCNRLVNFSRSTSNLHESQLNFKLLKPLGLETEVGLDKISSYYGFRWPELDTEKFKGLIDPDKLNVIFHPKSKGSAREWPLVNYKQLAQQLPKDKFQVFITGSLDEGKRILAENPDFFLDNPSIDLTGKFTLEEFVSFITAVDGIVACSTGPLHIAAALGKSVAGIYPPIRPMHPGRWKPIGEKVEVFSLDKNCNDCRKSTDCACINAISVNQLAKALDTWTRKN
jgi:ADP-heptose:LPS heptosyltransferase